MIRTPLDRRLFAEAVTALLPETPVSPLTASLFDAAIKRELPPFNPYLLAYLLIFPARVGRFIGMVSRRRAKTFSDLLTSAERVYFMILLNGGILELAARAALRPLTMGGIREQFGAHIVTRRDEAQIELRALADFARYDRDIGDALRAGHLPDDETFCDEWDEYLDTYGHRADLEIDLAVPRLYECPEKLMRAIVEYQPRVHRRCTLARGLWFPLGVFAEQAVLRRERFLYYSAFGLARLRKQFLHLAEQAVERGQLTEAEAIWQMDINALKQLDETHT